MVLSKLEFWIVKPFILPNDLLALCPSVHIYYILVVYVNAIPIIYDVHWRSLPFLYSNHVGTCEKSWHIAGHLYCPKSAAAQVSFSTWHMITIPPEIWFHIAKFIPNKDLRDLLGVNSVFFNVAMDIRYREIVISTRTACQDMKTLKRIRYMPLYFANEIRSAWPVIVSDPLVASRVYRLSLRLTHVKKASDSTSASSSRSDIRHQLKHTIIHAFRSPNLKSSQPTDLINEILNIADKLVNVRELYIDLLNLPPFYDLQPLVSSFWSSFGPKLCTLSLCGVLEDFRTLLNSNPILGRLQELRVEFSHSGIDATETSSAILVDILLPFINSLAPHLLSLRLWSWASFDLSTFFSQLAPFPGLKALNVRTPFNSAFGDASGLKGLICDSSDTLQRVDLRLNPAGLTVDPSSEGPLSRWLLECISDKRFFSKLQVLDIYPTNMAAGMEFLLGCIQRTSDNLVKLIVRDRYLQDREIKTVIDAASSCRNLTYLKMNIRRLDIALTDRLALKLPQINGLWLSIGENSANDPNYLIVCITL